MNSYKWLVSGLMTVALCLFAVEARILAAQTPAAAPRQIDGTVLDRQGLPINGATVTVTQMQGNLQKLAQSSTGKFKVDGLAAAMYYVKVDAAGFSAQTMVVDLRTQTSAPVEVRLEPAGHSEEVSVAATRSEQRLSSVPESVSVLNEDEIRNSPALVADDVLRQIPTYSLFRRSSSLVTHPTSQGVSLRGIGPSGGGRTLVMFDNAPFNDPFGGWVYWTRVPLMNATKMEVVDGTTSSLYGNYALGGVVSIDSRTPQKRTLIFQPQFGIFSSKVPGQYDHLYTPKADFYVSDVYGKLGVSLEGSIMNSNGYPVVGPDDRGVVDTKANVHYSNFNFKANYALTSKVNIYFNGGRFTENRNNAKVATTVTPGVPEGNDTRWLSANSGVRATLPDGSNLQVAVNTNFEEFHSNFLAVPAAVPPRSVSRQTLTQRVPVKSVNGMAQWTKTLGGRNILTAGIDSTWVEGSTNETAFAANGTQTLTRVAGGKQQYFGGFLQDMIAVTPKLRVTLSGRLDHWKNYDASRVETDLNTGDQVFPVNAVYADKTNSVGSPHAAALYKFTDRVSAWGGVSWGFRAPTLNELYRQFSVGTTLTTANDQLGPERLFGWESGVNVEPIRNLTWRNTFFDNDFNHAVSNITISSTPALITQQRQNVGQAHVWGIQSDAEYRLFTYWKINAAYIYDIARVAKFDANPAQIGKSLAQVPRHRGTAGLTYTNKRFVDVGAAYHYTSDQFDDDTNDPTRRLDSFATVDLTVSRQVHETTDVFFNMQNLLNREFVVQTLPRTIGAPRQITFGFRFHI
jgi:outer membrane receptor protein involved in Fe transport